MFYDRVFKCAFDWTHSRYLIVKLKKSVFLLREFIKDKVVCKKGRVSKVKKLNFFSFNLSRIQRIMVVAILEMLKFSHDHCHI